MVMLRDYLVYFSIFVEHYISDFHALFAKHTGYVKCLLMKLNINHSRVAAHSIK